MIEGHNLQKAHKLFDDLITVRNAKEAGEKGFLSLKMQLNNTSVELGSVLAPSVCRHVICVALDVRIKELEQELRTLGVNA
jgi:hypothetical protein